MKRVRITRPGARRERPGAEVLPLDPRDPEIVRVKSIFGRRATSQGASPVSDDERGR